MKKSITLLAFCMFCIGKMLSQTFSPITLTGYNWDAIAEATTIVSHVTGPIDGSNYVMYSVSYGTVYNVSTGLPNSGVITAGTSTYQLGTYSVNNICLTTATVTTDSLTFATPGSYSGLSLLCFSTEGSGSMNVTVRFTDNTTQTYTSQALYDWFTSSGAVYSGYDRVSTTTGVPAGAGSNPNMFTINLPISCANRSKSIKNVKFQNTASGPRNCILAISGAGMPTFTTTSNPVTCNGGTNGTASVIPSGGIAPYTYTWSTTPVQTGSGASNLPVGIYTVTAQDAGLCPVTTTVAVTLSLAAQPSLSVTSNVYTICAGAAITLSTSGANTYTWSTSANTTTISANPTSNITYTVGGYTSYNCYRTGSVSITVNQLPVITFTAPSSICLNTPQFTMSATPAAGNFAGPGTNNLGQYTPTLAGVGSKTVSYTYTDSHGCTSIVVNTIVVNALPVVSFTLSANPLCANSNTFNLTATPPNGTFTGAGVSGSVYTPSVAGVGTQTVAYNYTDANNCSVQKVSSVVINAVPVPVIQTTKKFFCTTTPTLYLNAQPSGGVFTGAGTSTVGIFSPSLAGAGNHTITYTYTDANGCVGTALFGATVSLCEGIAENSAPAVSLVVYPNPTSGMFTVKSASQMNLTIVNDLGQIVSLVSLNEDNGYQISVADLPHGLYFISGQNEQQLVRQKIIVAKQ